MLLLTFVLFESSSSMEVNEDDVCWKLIIISHLYIRTKEMKFNCWHFVILSIPQTHPHILSMENDISYTITELQLNLLITQSFFSKTHTQKALHRLLMRTLNSYSVVSVRLQICTCHDSLAVMTCTKLWPDLIIIVHLWARLFFFLFIKFGLWAHASLCKMGARGVFQKHLWALKSKSS